MSVLHPNIEGRNNTNEGRSLWQKTEKQNIMHWMEEIETDILSGKIRPGEKLPSENQLSVRYGLSRHTVRKALGILAGDGYIESFREKDLSVRMCPSDYGTGNIAVVTTYISDYIFPRLIQGMKRGAVR